MNTTVSIFISIVVFLAAVALVAFSRNTIYETLDFDTKKKHTIWWIVDDSQVSSRKWLDWNSRTSFEPNEPYLAMCLRRARELWSGTFDIQPLIGRVAVHRRLEEAGVILPDGADRIPPAVWLPWCRAIILSTFGGLWLDGSVLPLDNGNVSLLARVENEDILTFGTDPDDESISEDKTRAPAPGRSAGWAKNTGHPMWAGIARDLGAIISAGDQSWGASVARSSLLWAWDKHGSGSPIDRVAEVSRDMYGRRLELDTLLGENTWPTGTKDGGYWVPFPDGRDGLERAPIWKWFTRMSEEQIRESNFVWAKWASGK